MVLEFSAQKSGMQSARPSGDTSEPSSDTRPEISVLIPSKNRPGALRRCVESLMAQDYGAFQILIGDDGSRPAIDESDFAGTDSVPIRLIRSDTSVGLIGMRTRLMEASTSEILLLLDDDVTLARRDSLSRIEALFREHEAAGLIAPVVVDHVEGRQNVLGPGREPHATSPGVRDTGYFVGAAFAVRRDTIESDGVPLVISGYGHEEVEISYRVAASGLRMLCDPTITADHHRASAQPSRGDRLLRFHSAVRNRFLIARTYLPNPFRTSHIAFWIVRYFVMAIRRRMFLTYTRGLRDGLAARISDRYLLPDRAVRYLIKTGGRVWY